MYEYKLTIETVSAGLGFVHIHIEILNAQKKSLTFRDNNLFM